MTVRRTPRVNLLMTSATQRKLGETMRKSVVSVFITVAAIAAVAAPAFATDCTQAGNLVSNCGFVNDLSTWIFTADSATHISDDGASTPGSAELDRYDALGAIEAFTQCFSVSPSTPYGTGASYRVASGTGVYGCSLDVVKFTDGSCGAYTSQSSYPFEPTSRWLEVTRNLVTGPAVHSVQLRLACFSPSDFLIRIDDFIFGEGIVFSPIFSDGFEWGTTLAWPTTFP